MSLPTPYYDKGGITLYCGDCRDILPHLEPGSVDLVLTDPPYGIGFKSNGHRFKGASEITNDQSQDCGQWVIDCAMGWGCSVATFASPWLPWRGKFRNLLVWNKGEHVGIGGDRATCWKRTWELIQVQNASELRGKRDGAVLAFNALLPPPTGHVAEKPVALICYLIDKLSDHGQLVLDPFSGSGTTLRAAKDLGRRAIGIELDEQWCRMTVERLRQEVLF